MLDTKVIAIDPMKDSRWDAFVMTHQHGTIYHHSIWKELIQRTYGYTSYFLMLEDLQKNILGILPLFHVRSWLTGNRLVSIPFAHACGPLAYSSESVGKLVDYAVRYARDEKSDYLEIRTQGNTAALSSSDLVKHSYFSSFVLQLNTDPLSLWPKFGKKSIQYSIKKAQKSDISIVSAESFHELEAFYELNLKTRRKHGMPPQPFSFFENLWTLLGMEGMAKVLMAEHKGEYIAGIMWFAFKDTIIYMYNVSEQEYLHLCPNHLLLWEAIQWACRSGYRLFDFGRTSPDNQGLWNFKRRWGTNEVPITHYYWPHIAGPASTEESSIKFQILTSFWRRLPVILTRAFAPYLYKHLG